jgi:hypothetical protein
MRALRIICRRRNILSALVSGHASVLVKPGNARACYLYFVTKYSFLEASKRKHLCLLESSVVYLWVQTVRRLFVAEQIIINCSSMKRSIKTN